VVTDETHGEILTVYTERSAVPNSLWLSLLQTASNGVDILVYAGLHLPEANPAWVKEIERKCEEAVPVRIAFHSTALYNSILRFDDQMLVNPHIYSMPAFRAPVLHLRKIQGGPLFDTYMECFERIWADSRPLNVKDGQ
jgi:hypothetical protein